jgi:hypothetical protein
MVFLLRAADSPQRTLREIDEAGTERTFWLFREGSWVVCLRTAQGEVTASWTPELEVELRDGGTVMVVEVSPRPACATVDESQP